ncbi:hypothetical protein C2G38_2218522 [Gigaspora rosea]|uniref:Uncharacterized protein n=1 Tax=Gigaspora rosea TaxID=44941 RepID=A0A397U9T9_9GLOM|nr:hypothetical protein C2G38_2218522 [Gigaspora rosea]
MNDDDSDRHAIKKDVTNNKNEVESIENLPKSNDMDKGEKKVVKANLEHVEDGKTIVKPKLEKYNMISLMKEDKVFQINDKEIIDLLKSDELNDHGVCCKNGMCELRSKCIKGREISMGPKFEDKNILVFDRRKIIRENSVIANLSYKEVDSENILVEFDNNDGVIGSGKAKKNINKDNNLNDKIENNSAMESTNDEKGYIPAVSDSTDVFDLDQREVGIKTKSSTIESDPKIA